MEAYELLNSMKNSGNSYADVITDIITKQEEVITKECLGESEKVSSIPMKELELCLVKATENICSHIDELNLVKQLSIDTECPSGPTTNRTITNSNNSNIYEKNHDDRHLYDDGNGGKCTEVHSQRYHR